MTVNDIVKRARRSLGDSDTTGWTDATLIDYVDQAQKDLCKVARIYKRTLYLGILNDVRLYPLPSDCFQVDRVEYLDRPLNVLSREDQDTRYKDKWLHIIKSDLNMDSIEISHYISSSNYANFIKGLSADTSSFNTPSPAIGVVSEASNSSRTFVMGSNNHLGVTTGLEITYDDLKLEQFGDISGYMSTSVNQIEPNTANRGLLTQLNITEPVNNNYFGFLTVINNNYTKGTYGPCTDVLSLDTYLKIYYSAMSYTVDSLYDALIVDDIWEKALVHYVVATARQDDNDEGNYQIGIREMKYYDIEVKKAKKLQARTYTSNVSEIKETQYRRI